jgi:hypothetical protein
MMNKIALVVLVTASPAIRPNVKYYVRNMSRSFDADPMVRIDKSNRYTSQAQRRLPRRQALSG